MLSRGIRGINLSRYAPKQVTSQTTRRAKCETSVWELFGTDNTRIFMIDPRFVVWEDTFWRKSTARKKIRGFRNNLRRCVHPFTPYCRGFLFRS